MSSRPEDLVEAEGVNAADVQGGTGAGQEAPPPTETQGDEVLAGTADQAHSGPGQELAADEG